MCDIKIVETFYLNFLKHNFKLPQLWFMVKKSREEPAWRIVGEKKNKQSYLMYNIIYQPSKHDHMGPMWAIGGQIAIWVL